MNLTSPSDNVVTLGVLMAAEIATRRSGIFPGTGLSSWSWPSLKA